MKKRCESRFKIEGEGLKHLGALPSPELSIGLDVKDTLSQYSIQIKVIDVLSSTAVCVQRVYFKY